MVPKEFAHIKLICIFNYLYMEICFLLDYFSFQRITNTRIQILFYVDVFEPRFTSLMYSHLNDKYARYTGLSPRRPLFK